MIRKWKFGRLAKCLLGLTIPAASVFGTVACLSVSATKEIDGEDVVFSYKTNDGQETYVKANDIWSDIQNGQAQNFNEEFFNQIIHMIMIQYYKNNTDHADYFENWEETVSNNVEAKEDQYKTQYGTDWEGRLQQEVYDPVGGKENYVNNELYTLMQSEIENDLKNSQITIENNGGFGDLTDAQKALAYDYVAVAKPVFSRQIAFTWSDGASSASGKTGSYYDPYISSKSGSQESTSPINNFSRVATAFKNNANNPDFLLDNSILDSITDAGSAAQKKQLISFNSPISDSRFEYAFLTILATQLAGKNQSLPTINIDNFTDEDVLQQAFDPDASSNFDLYSGIWKGPADPNDVQPFEQVILDVGGGWQAGRINKTDPLTGGPEWINPTNGTQIIPNSSGEFQTIKKVVSGNNTEVNGIYFVRANDGFYFVQIDPTFLGVLNNQDDNNLLKTYTEEIIAHYKEQKNNDVTDDNLDYDLIGNLSDFISSIGNEKAFFKMLLSVNRDANYDLDLDPLDYYLSKITIEPKYQEILTKIYNSQISGMISELTDNVYTPIDSENNDESKDIPVEFMPLFKDIYGSGVNFQNLVQDNYLNKLSFQPISAVEENKNA